MENSLFALTGDIDSTILTDGQLKILEKTLKVAKEHAVPYWIFITPDPPESLAGLLETITRLNKNVIICSHGFKHIRFSGLGYEQQVTQLKKSMQAFHRVGVELFAVRTPYLSLNKHTYKAISDSGFALDFSTSFGFKSSKIFPFLFPRRLRETIFIPLTTPSDTYFRRRKVSWKKMSRVWIKKAKQIYAKRGVLSFLVHPAGYRENPEALNALLEYVCKQEICLLSECLHRCRQRREM